MVPFPTRADASFRPDVKANEFKSNELLPVQPRAKRQVLDTLDPPTCTPCGGTTLSASNTGNGWANIIFDPCPPLNCPIYYRLYRATGTGPFAFLTDLGSATSYTDHTTIPGKTESHEAVGTSVSLRLLDEHGALLADHSGQLSGEWTWSGPYSSKAFVYGDTAFDARQTSSYRLEIQVAPAEEATLESARLVVKGGGRK
jgi:hypothetical protein